MFTFIRTGGPYGDCTCDYDIKLDKEYTVAEFVKTVLENKPDEWGYIGIWRSKTIFGDPTCRYDYGKLRSTLPDDILDKKIRSVDASGGWTRMDYLLVLEDD